VRALAHVGIAEQHFGAALESRADGLGKRSAARWADKRRALFLLVGINQHADLRQPLEGPQVGLLERDGNSTATTWGRSSRIARRTSMANSSRPGATGR